MPIYNKYQHMYDRIKTEIDNTLGDAGGRTVLRETAFPETGGGTACSRLM